MRDMARYERHQKAQEIRELAVAPFPPLQADEADKASDGIMCRHAASAMCDFEDALVASERPNEAHDRLFAREATASSHIEEEGREVAPQMIAGLLSSMRSGEATLSVHAADYGLRSGVSSILCCVTATQHLADSKLSTASLTRAHKSLMRYRSDKRPGRFRATGHNSYIATAGNVVYVPPLGGPAIRQMVTDLLRWVDERMQHLNEIQDPQSKWAHAVAVSGIAHMRFEAIHPFSDGNGRLGRSLAEAILMSALPNRLRAPVGIGSAFSHPKARSGYYSALDRFRDEGSAFADWWSEMVEVAADTALSIIRSGSDESWADSSWFD